MPDQSEIRKGQKCLGCRSFVRPHYRHKIRGISCGCPSSSATSPALARRLRNVPGIPASHISSRDGQHVRLLVDSSSDAEHIERIPNSSHRLHEGLKVTEIDTSARPKSCYVACHSSTVFLTSRDKLARSVKSKSRKTWFWGYSANNIKNLLCGPLDSVHH